MAEVLPAVVVPEAPAASHRRHFGDAGRHWIADLPRLAGEYLDRWRLTPDGVPAHGRVALVLPVRRDDGASAALKCQPVDAESVGEPTALRAWAGAGAVRLLDHDAATGTMLLERLDAERSLESVPDAEEATAILGDLAARLSSVSAPPGMRELSTVAVMMLDTAPRAAPSLRLRRDRRLLENCASALADVASEPGDFLLHWDLHYGNVLAADRESWLVIDPKPLTGDPCFELFPALHNRWHDIVATGNVGRAVRRRFDLLVERLGVDRARAVSWTLGRVLQNVLWDVREGATEVSPVHRAIAEALRPGCSRP